MYRCLVALTLFAAACTTTAQPREVTVAWSRGPNVYIGDYCTHVSVAVEHADHSFEEHTLPCDATTDAVTLIDGEAAHIAVHYWYWEIPDECGDQSCFIDRTYANGEATYDGKSDQVTLTVNEELQFP